MRTLSRHLTPMYRQVQESLSIIKGSSTPEESLNLKSDWGGSKFPGLDVLAPKGIGNGRLGKMTQDTQKIDPEEGRGDKRVRSGDREESEQKKNTRKPNREAKKQTPGLRRGREG